MGGTAKTTISPTTTNITIKIMVERSCPGLPSIASGMLLGSLRSGGPAGISLSEVEETVVVTFVSEGSVTSGVVSSTVVTVSSSSFSVVVSEGRTVVTSGSVSIQKYLAVNGINCVLCMGQLAIYSDYDIQHYCKSFLWQIGFRLSENCKR